MTISHKSNPQRGIKLFDPNSAGGSDVASSGSKLVVQIFRRDERHSTATAFMMEERLAHAGINGASGAHPSSDYQRTRKTIVPPYDPAKFPNKWRKMEPHMPARTLMARIKELRAVDPDKNVFEAAKTHFFESLLSGLNTHWPSHGGKVLIIVGQCKHKNDWLLPPEHAASYRKTVVRLANPKKSANWSNSSPTRL